MKRITALLLAALLFVSLCAAACAEDWTFEHGVTIVCPWGGRGSPISSC